MWSDPARSSAISAISAFCRTRPEPWQAAACASRMPPGSEAIHAVIAPFHGWLRPDRGRIRQRTSAADGRGAAGAAAPPSSGRSVNWALHNLDLAGSRYSAMDQITRSNVATLSPRWLFQYGIIDGVSNQTTPVVVDGVMYRDRPARQRLRARRRRRAPALELRRHGSDRRRAPRGLRLPEPRRRVRQRRGVHARRDRFCLRSTRRPANRSRRSGRTARPP